MKLVAMSDRKWSWSPMLPCWEKVGSRNNNTLSHNIMNRLEDHLNCKWNIRIIDISPCDRAVYLMSDQPHPGIITVVDQVKRADQIVDENDEVVITSQVIAVKSKSIGVYHPHPAAATVVPM